MGAGFLLRCKRGALQYVIVRLLTTLAEVGLNYLEPRWRDAAAGELGSSVLVLLSNGSQMWAMCRSRRLEPADTAAPPSAVLGVTTTTARRRVEPYVPGLLSAIASDRL